MKSGSVVVCGSFSIYKPTRERYERLMIKTPKTTTTTTNFLTFTDKNRYSLHVYTEPSILIALLRG